MTAIPKAVRLSVLTRASLLCEACGKVRGEHLHHRRLRSQGGKHTPENLLLVCSGCHDGIHMNPADSYLRGLLVRSYLDPADIAVRPYYMEVADVPL